MNDQPTRLSTSGAPVAPPVAPEGQDDREGVVEWLQERHANCLRIAALAGCDDPEEWMSDARYFKAAINLIALQEGK